MTIIGIDCATDDAKIGLALGNLDEDRLDLLEVVLCSRSRSASSTVAGWLVGNRTRNALLAIDAPLGWPVPLSVTLATHSAGSGIGPSANDLFRRNTDSFIKRELGQTPLDVGADRIARTAHSALRLLSSLRQELQQPVQLAWSSGGLPPISAIEVYPAATLVAHRMRSKGYKKATQIAERCEIVAALSMKMQIPESITGLFDNPDCLDAAVCVLAAADFVAGRAMEPTDLPLAMREGWIWAARREG